MKVKFYSEILDKYFDTKDDCFKAEAEVKAKKEREHELYQAFMKAKEDYELASKNFYEAKKMYIDYVNNQNVNKQREVNLSFEDIFKYLFEK